MGLHPSARWGVVAWVLCAGAAVCGASACNALLGTPDPELAGDGGADATIESAAGDGGGPDATTRPDATPQDAQGAQDAVVTESAVDAFVDGALEAAPVEAGGPPSCPGDGGPGVTTCGSFGDGCCNSFLIGGGAFSRSFVAGGDGGATVLEAGAAVSTFRLDEYEVTVGRFRQFVAATEAGWTPVPGAGKHSHLNGGLGLFQDVQGAPVYESGWVAAWDANTSQPDGGGAGAWDGTLTSCAPSTWTPMPASQESLPINCINWYEAYAFCIWDGGFLPTSAEWEYAAAGGSEQREYPWGATDPGIDSQYAVYGCEYPDGGGTPDATGTCHSTSNIAPVGSAPMGQGRWAQLDLAGNVHERLLDYDNTTDSYLSPCTDCVELTPNPTRQVTGGNWLVSVNTLSVQYHAYYAPIERDQKAGVRCARVP